MTVIVVVVVVAVAAIMINDSGGVDAVVCALHAFVQLVHWRLDEVNVILRTSSDLDLISEAGSMDHTRDHPSHVYLRSIVIASWSFPLMNETTPHALPCFTLHCPVNAHPRSTHGVRSTERQSGKGGSIRRRSPC